MNTIKLQGIYNPVKAIPAGVLKVGMVTVWNYDYEEVVTSVEPTKSGKSVKVGIKTQSGYESIRTMRVDRLVGVRTV